MEPKTLSSFSKELIEAVSRGSAAKAKIIFCNYLKVLEDINFKEITNLKVRKSSSSGICNLNALHTKSTDETHNFKQLVNLKDKQGRTPLQIAARLGFDEICKLLIDNGADIDTQSENCPSLLMLAASNNHSNVVRLLLEHDVRKNRSDSFYAAIDEAASKSHSEVKDLMSSHIINKALNDSVKTKEFDLCMNFRNSLHKLLMQENKHPVRLILDLKENCIILKNIGKCIDILNMLCEQKFANNEELSWEYNEIAFTLITAEGCLNYRDSNSDKSIKSDEYILDSLIKYWLTDQPTNDFSSNLLIHFEAIIVSYPFKGSNIYRTKNNQPIQGFCNRFILTETCETCRNRNGLKLCSGCRNIKYCSQTCQNLHWFVHKTECKKSCLNFQEIAKALETKLILNN